jgi:Protein of unknown function (DUF2783)
MLITNANLARPDDIYAYLIATHDGMDEPTSHAMNARLVLILMNHIGDDAVLRQAIDLAKATAPIKG